jgi:hypothetical protein
MLPLYERSKKMLGGNVGIMVGLSALSVVSDMNHARAEGRSPLSAGIRSAATQALPIMLTAGIKSPVRQMFYMGLLQNPMMLPKAFSATFRFANQKYMNLATSSLPFSHSYTPSAQAYQHMQNSLQQMGDFSQMGSQAASFSARYLANRY